MAGVRTAAQYQSQLRSLLPSGPAWDPERVPELEEVLEGVSQELARLDARAADLLNEMDPAGASELVPDWERVMNLPDPAWVRPRCSTTAAWPCAGGCWPSAARRSLTTSRSPVARVIRTPPSPSTKLRAWAAHGLVTRISAPGRRNSCGRSTPVDDCSWAGALARVTGASVSA